ncbi:uncharacterized protein LOC112568509 [Pomacea canaliculata]|uniref:uncharacterized protein LOC112568509 n=1 Tax=Pomacea canaliculata TaxID=400727 RepID=UPI000D73CBA9|nr:uncharacterized protein LOC112568509 [Pomacea canaliculata]
MSVLLVLSIVIFISCFPAADAFGVELECPDFFRNGENTVTCRINKTAIREAHCFSMYKSVTFDWTLNDRTTVACLSPDYDPDAQCTTQNDPGSCRCQESNGEILTYKFFFLANRTLDEGGQLECKLCILPENPLPINISRGCRNISFADDSDTPRGDQSNIAAVIAAVVSVAIIVLVIVIIFVITRKKHHCQLPCRKKGKDNKGHGDISHKGENGFTGQQTGLLDTTENIQMTTNEDLHANKQHEKCLNGNAKNIDH